MHYIGEISAIGAAISWSACALFFTAASHRVGSFSMNHYKWIFAVIIIAVVQLLLKGSLVPTDISIMNWFLLILSGLLGCFLADACLMQSYVDIGPRLGVLVFNFYPLISALLAWMFLKEILSVYAWMGIIITISAIVWVTLEKKSTRTGTHKSHFMRGINFAIGAGIFQAISFIIVKPAMEGNNATDPLTATLIRATVGGTAYWVVTIARGRLVNVLKKSLDVKTMSLIAVGALFGSFIGIWLSMVAVKLTPVGIAATLMALMPIAILPMVAVVHKERISVRAIIGAVIACLGIAILFNA